MSRKEAGWGNSFLPFTTSCRVSVCLKPSTLSSISYTNNLICHCEEGPFGCCGGRQKNCKGCKWLQAELWRGLPDQPLQGISELLIALLVQNHLQQWGQRLKCFALQLAEAKGTNPVGIGFSYRVMRPPRGSTVQKSLLLMSPLPSP